MDAYFSLEFEQISWNYFLWVDGIGFYGDDTLSTSKILILEVVCKP